MLLRGNDQDLFILSVYTHSVLLALLKDTPPSKSKVSFLLGYWHKSFTHAMQLFIV